MSALNRTLSLLTAIILSVSLSLSAQNPQPQGKITVSLLTCAPGQNFYELEGHSGLRFTDNKGFDYTANWGVFSFNEPGFLYRFVKGETDYMLAMYPTDIFLEQYRQENRCVTEQVLNLDSLQAQKAFELVLENLKPENKIYRYNYLFDNCATRPLTIIEKSYGNLDLPDPKIGIAIPTTFRQVMRFYHANYPWYQFGIDIALGSDIDTPISKKSISFAPHALNRMIKFTDDYSKQMIVAQQNTLVEGPEDGNPLSPTPWILSPMAFTILILLIALWVSVRDYAIRKCTSLFNSLFFGALGLCGCIVAYLIVISVHEATSPNYNILWLNPLLILVPILAYTRWRHLLVYLQIINIVAIGCYATIWFLGIQIGNPAFIPLLCASAIRAIVRITLPTR